MARAAFKWKPEYCEGLIAHMTNGKSATSYAGEIGVDHSTIFEWAKVYPDFEAALGIGRAKRVGFWEDMAINAAQFCPEGLRAGSAAVIIFTLKNAAPAEYSDRIMLAGDPAAPLALVADDLSLARAVAFLLQRAEHAARPAPRVIEGCANGSSAGDVDTAQRGHRDGPE